MTTPCPLCRAEGDALWRNDELRVIDAGIADHPGYTRVIWAAHAKEMTDLPADARDRLMQAVWAVEQALRDTLSPDKINLAEFGNQVPHLHWHIIPRWRTDTHFPDAIWAAPAARSAEQRAQWTVSRTHAAERLPAYHAALRQALDALAQR
jgi:diadenosine tetraphosphate (Ap4A) HIT family hydrolase